MKKYLDKLDALIREGGEIRELIRDIANKPDAERENRQARKTRWLSSSNTILRQIGLSEHADKAEAIVVSPLYPANALAQVTAVIQSARDLVSEGFLAKAQDLLEANIYGSVLDQADALLASRHETPAAVLGRIVIEGWVRREAARAGIPSYDSAKAATLNDELKKSGTFSTPRWRLVQGHLDVGNSAAHGKNADFTMEDVRRLLEFARNLCV